MVFMRRVLLGNRYATLFTIGEDSSIKEETVLVSDFSFLDLN